MSSETFLEKLCEKTFLNKDNNDPCHANIEIKPGYPYAVSIQGKNGSVTGIGPTIEKACEDALESYDNGPREDGPSRDYYCERQWVDGKVSPDTVYDYREGENLVLFAEYELISPSRRGVPSEAIFYWSKERGFMYRYRGYHYNNNKSLKINRYYKIR